MPWCSKYPLEAENGHGPILFFPSVSRENNVINLWARENSQVHLWSRENNTINLWSRENSHVNLWSRENNTIILWSQENKTIILWSRENNTINLWSRKTSDKRLPQRTLSARLLDFIQAISFEPTHFLVMNNDVMNNQSADKEIWSGIDAVGDCTVSPYSG